LWEFVCPFAFGAEQKHRQMNMVRLRVSSEDAFVSFTGGSNKEILNVPVHHIDSGRNRDCASVFAKPNFTDFKQAWANLFQWHLIRQLSATAESGKAAQADHQQMEPPFRLASCWRLSHQPTIWRRAKLSTGDIT